MPQDKQLAQAQTHTAERDASPLSLDTAVHAGQLALAIAELASVVTNKGDLARQVTGLLAHELGPCTAAWYWCEAHPDPRHRRHAPHLKRAVILGDATNHTYGRLLHASAEAAAASRSLVLRAGRTAASDQQPEHVIACPLGAPEPRAVFVLAAPASSEKRSHRIAVLSRLLPTLAFAISPYTHDTSAQPVQKASSQGAVSGLFTADYLSILSHDLRTPLHTIGGFLEMVHDGMAGPINERQHEFLGYARTGTQQLGAMLEDVLLLSRADSGGLSLRNARVEVASLLYSVLSGVQAEAQVRQVRVVADLPQNLPPLLGDEERLKHALSRVVSHAVSRGPAGSNVEISATRAEDAVTITVKDAGPEISEQRAQDLFSYVARKGTGRQAEGVSLGLVVARLLVELHGGHVELQRSTRDETIIAVTLPAGV